MDESSRVKKAPPLNSIVIVSSAGQQRAAILIASTPGSFDVRFVRRGPISTFLRNRG